MFHLSPFYSWALVTLGLAPLFVWAWFFIWSPEEPKKSYRYSVRCVQCRWYGIAPNELEAAQMYAKHYEADHA